MSTQSIVRTSSVSKTMVMVIFDNVEQPLTYFVSNSIA